MSLLDLPFEILTQILSDANLSRYELKNIRLVHRRLSFVAAGLVCRSLRIEYCIKCDNSTCREIIKVGLSKTPVSVEMLVRLAPEIRNLDLAVVPDTKPKSGFKGWMSGKLKKDRKEERRKGNVLHLLSAMTKLSTVKLAIADVALLEGRYKPLLISLNEKAEDRIRLEVAVTFPNRYQAPTRLLCEAIFLELFNLQSLNLHCKASNDYDGSAEHIGTLLSSLHQLDTLDIGCRDSASMLDMDTVLAHAFSSPIITNAETEKLQGAILPLRSLSLTNAMFPTVETNVRRLHNLNFLYENSLAPLAWKTRNAQPARDLYDAFYPLLGSNGIFLETLDISSIGPGLYAYLRHPGVVQTLVSLTLDCPIGSELPNTSDSEAFAVEFWQVILPAHAKTLRHLSVTPFYTGSWCWSPRSPCATAIQNCQKLETLGLCPCLPNEVYILDMLKSLARSKSADKLKLVRIESTWSGIKGSGRVIERCREVLDKSFRRGITRLYPPVGKGEVAEMHVQQAKEDVWVYVYQHLPNAVIEVGPEFVLRGDAKLSLLMLESGMV